MRCDGSSWRSTVGAWAASPRTLSQAACLAQGQLLAGAKLRNVVTVTLQVRVFSKQHLNRQVHRNCTAGERFA